MRIGICERDNAAFVRLSRWITQYCRAYGIEPELSVYGSADDIFRAMSLRRFDLIFGCFDGPDGFLCARRIRESDKNVRLVLISDTSSYAVHGVRLHFSDYIVKPVEFRHVVRAMKLCNIG